MSRAAARITTALALLGLIVAVAGCGNAKHNFRDHKLDPLVTQLTTQRATLATSLRIARPHRKRDAGVLRTQVTAIGATMQKIAALKPPSGTQPQFHRYVRANAMLLTALNRFVDAFATGTAAQQRVTGQAAQGAISNATDAKAALERALE